MFRVDTDKNYDTVYCLENGTLKNKLGITDKRKLDLLANRAASYRKNQFKVMSQLNMPIYESGWNADMLKDIHRALLGDVYEWAGEFRTVDVGISYDHVAYEKPENVPAKLEEVFDYINERNCFKGEEEGQKIVDLALVYGMIKVLQPFRDGNTRTAITFTQLLANECGMTVDFSVYAKEPNLTKFGNAQVAMRDNDPNPLLWCFVDMIATVKERPELVMPKVVTGKQGDLLKTLQSLSAPPVERNKAPESKKPNKSKSNDRWLR